MIFNIQTQAFWHDSMERSLSGTWDFLSVLFLCFALCQAYCALFSIAVACSFSLYLVKPGTEIMPMES